MAKWIDNLQNFNSKIEIDKEYLKNIINDALIECAPRMAKKITLAPLEQWYVKRPLPQHNIKDNKEIADVVVQLLTKVKDNNILHQSAMTIKFYDKKFKYQGIYGLKEELTECPDFSLSKEDFKSKYLETKKTVQALNYSIMAFDTQESLAKEYKHLNMYMESILKAYCNIFEKHNLKYKFENKKYTNEDYSPLSKEITLLDSNENDFITINLNLFKELRIVNNRFMNDFRIRVSFLKNVEEKSPMLLNGKANSYKRRDPIKYNNNFNLMFLNQLENPNYYFLMASPRGLIKMNKDILQDSIQSVFTHYILAPLLKEANIEVEHKDIQENLGSYLQMYEMVKY